MEANHILALRSAHVPELTLAHLRRLGLPWANLLRALEEVNSALDLLQAATIDSETIRTFFRDTELTDHGTSVAFIAAVLRPALKEGARPPGLIERALLHEVLDDHSSEDDPDQAEDPQALLIETACQIDRMLKKISTLNTDGSPAAAGHEILELLSRNADPAMTKRVSEILPGLSRCA